jgi:hypothetical protein
MDTSVITIEENGGRLLTESQKDPGNDARLDDGLESWVVWL